MIHLICTYISGGGGGGIVSKCIECDCELKF